MKSKIIIQILVIFSILSLPLSALAGGEPQNQNSSNRSQTNAHLIRAVAVATGFAGAHNMFRGRLHLGLGLAYAGGLMQLVAVKVGNSNHGQVGMSRVNSISNLGSKPQAPSVPSSGNLPKEPGSEANSAR